MGGKKRKGKDKTQRKKMAMMLDLSLTHTPLMRSLIWDWTCPFSRFCTTVLAILVRWPMLPLLVPPSALEILEAIKTTVREKASTLYYISLIKSGYMVKNWSSSYWIRSFSSQASRILCTRRHCWKSCTIHTDRTTGWTISTMTHFNTISSGSWP